MKLIFVVLVNETSNREFQYSDYLQQMNKKQKRRFSGDSEAGVLSVNRHYPHCQSKSLQKSRCLQDSSERWRSYSEVWTDVLFNIFLPLGVSHQLRLRVWVYPDRVTRWNYPSAPIDPGILDLLSKWGKHVWLADSNRRLFLYIFMYLRRQFFRDCVLGWSWIRVFCSPSCQKTLKCLGLEYPSSGIMFAGDRYCCTRHFKLGTKFNFRIPGKHSWSTAVWLVPVRPIV